MKKIIGNSWVLVEKQWFLGIFEISSKNYSTSITQVRLIIWLSNNWKHHRCCFQGSCAPQTCFSKTVTLLNEYTHLGYFYFLGRQILLTSNSNWSVTYCDTYIAVYRLKCKRNIWAVVFNHLFDVIGSLLTSTNFLEILIFFSKNDYFRDLV